MKLIFELLFLFGISILLATASTASTATAPDLTAQECRTLIGNLDPEGVNPAIVRQCTEYLIQNLRGDPVRELAYDSRARTLSVRIMPTRVHDVTQMWFGAERGEMCRNNFLTTNENLNLSGSSGTTFEGFVAPYAGSKKLPDWALTPNADTLPSIVVESG
ncbi:hypothetical protein BDV06DRAFT_220552 [Aspergillus oleicola]